MKEYNDALKFILENGVKSEDRTGEGTLSYFGYQMRFDLSKGFPAVTTKKLAWKAMVSELLWFLEGSSDEKRLREILHGDKNSTKGTIWTANAENQGKKLGYLNNELGPVYGYHWRFMYNDECFPVKKRISENVEFSLPQEDLLVEEGNNKHLGKIYTNKFSQKYKVIGVGELVSNGIKSKKHTFNIQYLKTKSVYYNVVNIGENNNHRDGFEATLYGVGMLGYYEHKKESKINKRLRKTWENMISRCYNPKDKRFESNSQNKVFVCDRWLVLSNFIEDSQKLDGWLWYNRYEDCVLDKDYYGNNNIYCPSTSVFIPRIHNNQYKVNTKPVMVEHPDFPTSYFPSYRAYLQKKPVGKVSEYNNENYVIRHQFPVDQIANLIHEIKTNPNSRRLILSSLDVGSVDKASLPPCHTFSQFYVRNGKLSCQMYQRSADFFLGVPFNIASYSLFTHMLAQVCGLEVGEFVHTFGDAHIYLNHLDAVNEQLQRTPYDLPQLKINKEIKDIEKFTMSDFELINYKHHDAIKAPMAV